MLLLVLRVQAEAPAVTVQPGNLPLLIVAGHGGKLPLPGAEIRDPAKVDDPRFVIFGDAVTNELATDLAAAVAQEAGGRDRPSLILNQIHRRYADVNRPPELTSHDAPGVAHHAVFHQAIENELTRLVERHGWALLLDLHGQAGYDTTLMLGTAKNSVISSWSLEALWGHSGLVDNLSRAGFSVEPRTPDEPQRYGGGFTIRYHGKGPRVEAWQMEHSRAIRDRLDERSGYLEVVARTLVRAMQRRPSAFE